MAKHTYIFKLEDEHMSQNRLQKLMMALEDAKIVSWKYTGTRGDYTSVQVFTDEYKMHEIFTKSGIWLDTREPAIKQARLHGDEANRKAAKRLDDLRTRRRVREARVRVRRLRKVDIGYEGIDETVEDYDRRVRETKRLDDLRRKRPLVPSGVRKETKRRVAGIAGPPIWAVVMLQRLTRAGCDVKLTPMFNKGFEIVVFGESFTMLDESEARGFLMGLAAGYKVAPSAPGSPQMGSTKATKRSKRSC